MDRAEAVKWLESHGFKQDAQEIYVFNASASKRYKVDFSQQWPVVSVTDAQGAVMLHKTMPTILAEFSSKFAPPSKPLAEYAERKKTKTPEQREEDAMQKLGASSHIQPSSAAMERDDGLYDGDKGEMRMIERKTALVEPVATTSEIVANFKRIQEIKREILNEDDFQDGKPLKSAFRKLGMAFGVETRILSKEYEEKPDGTFMWRFKVAAIAPNGRTVEAVAECRSDEPKFKENRQFNPSHVYATAQTRATSRAISDLIGGGEVSSEEL